MLITVRSVPKVLDVVHSQFVVVALAHVPPIKPHPMWKVSGPCVLLIVTLVCLPGEHAERVSTPFMH